MRGANFLPCPECGAGHGEDCHNKSTGEPTTRPHVARRKPTICGTYGGYQRHKRVGETPCKPCRDANARYQRTYRSDPTVKHQEALENAARSRALWRLANLHRSEFDALVSEEIITAFRSAS